MPSRTHSSVQRTRSLPVHTTPQTMVMFQQAGKNGWFLCLTPCVFLTRRLPRSDAVFSSWLRVLFPQKQSPAVIYRRYIVWCYVTSGCVSDWTHHERSTQTRVSAGHADL